MLKGVLVQETDLSPKSVQGLKKGNEEILKAIEMECIKDIFVLIKIDKKVWKTFILYL